MGLFEKHEFDFKNEFNSKIEFNFNYSGRKKSSLSLAADCHRTLTCIMHALYYVSFIDKMKGL